MEHRENVGHKVNKVFKDKEVKAVIRIRRSSKDHKGETGTNGNLRGTNGKSAYELAKASDSDGEVGTLSQWIASLKGNKGDKWEQLDIMN